MAFILSNRNLKIEFYLCNGAFTTFWMFLVLVVYILWKTLSFGVYKFHWDMSICYSGLIILTGSQTDKK